MGGMIFWVPLLCNLSIINTMISYNYAHIHACQHWPDPFLSVLLLQCLLSKIVQLWISTRINLLQLSGLSKTLNGSLMFSIVSAVLTALMTIVQVTNLKHGTSQLRPSRKFTPRVESRMPKAARTSGKQWVSSVFRVWGILRLVYRSSYSSRHAGIFKMSPALAGAHTMAVRHQTGMKKHGRNG